MTTKKKIPSLKANCHNCQKIVVVKYVYGFHSYSQKNNWGYWTEAPVNQKLYICDDCLVKLYRQYKWEFRQLIPNKEKQATLRQYIANGMIKGKTEKVFITNKCNSNYQSWKKPVSQKKKKQLMTEWKENFHAK